MLVLSMNSKRQRRPNVRLGEVGDIPAAFACGFSQKPKQNLGRKSYENDVLNHSNVTEHSDIYGFAVQTSPEFLVLGPAVSSRFSADLQQNWENKNPNASKSPFELVNSDEIDMTKLKLNFGNVTRKCRVMKRRGRCSLNANNVFGSVWNSELSSQLNNEDKKGINLKEFVTVTSDESDDYYHSNSFKDLWDHERPAISEEGCEFDVDEHAYDNDMEQTQNSNGYCQDDASPVSDHVQCEMKSGGGSDVNAFSVPRWLQEQGFGKYADLFEMHEVDNEALPLLTLEDLKEIGVSAVGPRRKLYTAIQQLR